MSRLAWAAFVASVVLGGCGTGEGLEPEPPPDAIAILVMTTGGDGQQTQWRFHSLRGVAHRGVVSPIPESTCILVSPGWTVDVLRVGAQDIPLGRAASGQFGNGPPVKLAIEIDASGSATISEGRPDWWVGKEQFCDASIR